MSTAPTVKQKLIDLWTARPGLAGVVITWAGPTEEGDLENEHIFFESTEQDEEFAQVGGSPTKREESYTLNTVLTVYMEGDDPKATEERAWAIRAEMSAAVRGNVQLDGLINFKCELGSTTMTTGTRDRGWAVVGEIDVDVVTRI